MTDGAKRSVKDGKRRVCQRWDHQKDRRQEKAEAREILINVSDSSEKQQIREELANVKEKDADKDNKIRLESKKKLKDKIGRSPDY